MPKQVLSKNFPSDPNLLPDIEAYIMKNLSNLNLNEEQKNSLSLSIAEAASNSIIHGNKGNKNLNLEVIIEKSPDLIRLKFIDLGDGFNPQNIPDPTAPENILKDSGRGIHIMKTFLTKLYYEFGDKGTTTVLELKL